MTWLNEQIQQDTITQNEDLLGGFVELLHMRNHTEVEPFTQTQVDEVFNRWLEKDDIQNSIYMRRYLITRQDLHRLFAEERRCLRNPGVSSPCDHQHRPNESHSLALLYRQKDNSAGAEKEDTNLLRTPVSAAQPSRSSTKVDVVGIVDPDQSDGFKHMRNFLPPQPSGTHSQDSDADNAITTREAIVMGSSSDVKMSRKSKRPSRRGRKHNKMSSDAIEVSVPPKNYICKRCNEPGHVIQHCPTNLDPHYDQAPARDYRCNFCGQSGDHYATLCPENRHESSLTIQREKAMMGTQEPLTPSRSGRRHYQDREASVISSGNRYRSRSPRQTHRDHYRSRSLERYRPRQRGADGYNPQTGNKDDRHWPQLSNELVVSPYTTRARLAPEFYMSLDVAQGKESPSRLGDDDFRLEYQDDTSSPSHRFRSLTSKRTRQQHRVLDNVTRSNEGRLAYDDEIDALVESESSLYSIGTDLPRLTISTSEEAVTESALSSAMVVPEDLNKIKIKAEDFLSALAADIMLEEENNPQSMVTNFYDAMEGVDGRPSKEIRIDENNNSDIASKLESPAAQTLGSKHLLVQCPPFSPEIVALFKTRENPIINPRTNRKTASQMIKRSEGILDASQ
ncbi:hypothetical protein F5Y12DRAFT_781404 [Xylaria sp. FL1777]|nr:hypothetical protein F5Y12DRAFT_781404 [Xylaria sp. FL1777]